METEQTSKDPLHGVTLQMMVERLVERYGFDELGRRIRVRCFNEEPSVKSSLVFLRRTEWARAKVERLYLKTFHPRKRPPKPAPRPEA